MSAQLAGVRDLTGELGADGELPGDWLWREEPGLEDYDGCWLLPAMVDLCCEAGYPGFPERERPETLVAAALAGGFLDLLLSPLGEPVRDLPEQIQPRWSSGVWLREAAAATEGLRGEQLSEIGLLRRRGAEAISDGGVPIGSTRALRNLLEYAGPHGIPVVLRAADPDLDGMGVVHESGLSAQIGLRGNPAAAEEIGIGRVLALLRAIRRPPAIHLTHISSRAGVALIRGAQAEGLPVTASVPARSLLLDEEVHRAGGYDSALRLHPPLREEADRRALVAGVVDGVLWISADHRPRAPEEKEQCFEQAAPGSTGLEAALPAAFTALTDPAGGAMGDEAALRSVARALSAGPLGLLGRRRASGWVLFDAAAAGRVAPERMRSLARNEALAGRVLRGAIRGVIGRG